MTDNHFFENKRVAFFTLGCKLNFAETSYLGQALLSRGMIMAQDGEPADLCLVNTCSVTELADKKSRQLIRRLHREHPSAKIVVTGCYAQLMPEEVASIEGVDLVIGAKDKGQLIDFIDQIDHISGPLIRSSDIGDVTQFAPSVSSEGRTRHFLKVQDGCDYRCSYCTIPRARGRSRNGTIEELVQMATEVAESGGREIVLTGVNVGDFGKSTGDSFIDLVRALDQVERIDRFRISSIEPNLLTEEVIRYVSSSARFAPHFHIPLQSGSNHVLGLMRRRYRREVFAERVTMVKSLMPHAYIGVDVIVGTRGEEEQHFDESYAFINSLPITRLHVFSYSERPDTDALKIKHTVDPRAKHRRSQALIALSDAKLHSFALSQIGTIRPVLIEHGREGDYLQGYTDNYLRVSVPYRAGLEGAVVPVRIVADIPGHPELMQGEICD